MLWKFFLIYVLVYVVFWRLNWYMRPIESAYNLGESANVPKFLYGLSTFGLGLGKFNEIISSSYQSEQISSFIFMAIQRPIPNVNPTVR